MTKMKTLRTQEKNTLTRSEQRAAKKAERDARKAGEARERLDAERQFGKIDPSNPDWADRYVRA
jgi:hypothetical protein